MWILFAFLAPALYAVAEIFDEYLSNRVLKKVVPLIFLALVLNFVFVPILFIIQKPIMPSAKLIWSLIGVGLTNLLYLFPYYKSLKVEDTSIVSAFFQLGK
jgi:drug/metabolite transporter (DMT)-like permease